MATKTASTKRNRTAGARTTGARRPTTSSTTRARRRTPSSTTRARRRTPTSTTRARRRTPTRAKRTATKPAATRRRATTRRLDAIALLKRDHRAVDQLFKRFRAARGVKAKANVVDRIVRELSIHAAIEEMLLYPAMRRVARKGDRLADEALAEHQEAKQQLRALEKMSPDDPTYDRAVRALIADVRRHVKEEESELFPRLRKGMSRDELLALAQALKAAKMTAPTRPHPRAPNKPPANLANMVTGMVDRARDAASRRRAS